MWGPSPLFPNMYIVLVGPSGCRKGTAMGPGYTFLRKTGIKLSAEATTREALIGALELSKDTTVAEDGTAYDHSSLTIFSQELTVFLGYNNVQLMSDLCDWFDCRDLWSYKTKHSGSNEVIGVWVNLIGATTPELIASTLPRDAIGGGLTARMIMVYANKKGKIVPIPNLLPEEIELGEILQADLEKICMMVGEFKITKDFRDLWIEWYTHQSLNPPFIDHRFTGYVERRGIHVLKLSMICSTSRSNDMIITGKDLMRATELLTTVEPQMPQIFGGVGKMVSADVQYAIMRYIEEHKDRHVTLSELLNRFYQDADLRVMGGILNTLINMDYVSPSARDNLGGIKAVKYKGGNDNEPINR